MINHSLDHSSTSVCPFKALVSLGFSQNPEFCAFQRGQEDQLMLGPRTEMEKKEKKGDSLREIHYRLLYLEGTNKVISLVYYIYSSSINRPFIRKLYTL